MRKGLVLLFAWPVLALAQSPSDSTTAAPVPTYIVKEITDARLSGEGKLTWFGLRVYDARLYVPERGLNLTDLDAQPFALELTYARKLAGRAIAERTREEMEKLGAGSEEQRAAWLREMIRIFPDVSAGHALTGIHLAHGATRFYSDGRPIGAIDDPAFGRAFFAIWLDARTSAPKLRTDLLQRVAR